MKNKTLLIIKPDAVRKKYIGKIISMIEEKNILIKKIKLLTLTQDEAEDLYIEHKNKPFYLELINFILSGPVVALILEGENIITQLRELIGHTDHKKAAAGTIRHYFASSLTENAVHASDKPDSATREIHILFKKWIKILHGK